MTVTERWVQTRESPRIRVRCVIHEGPPEPAHTVVMVPGWLSSAEEKQTVAVELARHARVIVLEARGHGGSDRPRVPGAYSIEAFARELGVVIEAFGLRAGAYSVFAFCLATGWTRALFNDGFEPRPAGLVLATPAGRYRGAALLHATARAVPDSVLAGVQRIATRAWIALVPGERATIEQTDRRVREQDGWVQRRIAAYCSARMPYIPTPSLPQLWLVNEGDPFVEAPPMTDAVELWTIRSSHLWIDGREREVADRVAEFLTRQGARIESSPAAVGQTP